MNLKNCILNICKCCVIFCKFDKGFQYYILLKFSWSLINTIIFTNHYIQFEFYIFYELFDNSIVLLLFSNIDLKYPIKGI